MVDAELIKYGFTKEKMKSFGVSLALILGIMFVGMMIGLFVGYKNVEKIVMETAHYYPKDEFDCNCYPKNKLAPSLDIAQGLSPEEFEKFKESEL